MPPRRSAKPAPDQGAPTLLDRHEAQVALPEAVGSNISWARMKQEEGSEGTQSSCLLGKVPRLRHYGGVVALCAHLSDVSRDFTRQSGPRQTTLAGAPQCLWMVARGLWMIPGVSFCLAGGFLLLPDGFSRLLGSGDKTVPMKPHTSKFGTVRKRCVQLLVEPC